METTTITTPPRQLTEAETIDSLILTTARKAAVAFDMGYTQARDALVGMNSAELVSYYQDFITLEARLRSRIPRGF